jgi:hypothetical protein
MGVVKVKSVDLVFKVSQNFVHKCRACGCTEWKNVGFPISGDCHVCKNCGKLQDNGNDNESAETIIISETTWVSVDSLIECLGGLSEDVSKNTIITALRDGAALAKGGK